MNIRLSSKRLPTIATHDSTSYMKTPFVILVRPQAFGNIGAIARSMANFGFSELRIVGDLPTKDPSSSVEKEISQSDWALATPRGQKILKNLKTFSSLESALSDCHIVIGTSGKKDEYHGGFSRPVVTPQKAFEDYSSFFNNFSDPKSLCSALVFGPEDDGLSSQEAGHCDILVHIPTAIEAPSMNLAMAATLVFYSFHQQQLKSDQNHISQPGKKIKQPSRSELADFSRTEQLTNYVLESLKPTQFFKHPDEDSTKARLRKVLRSWKLTEGDVLFVFEIFYQLRCWGNKKFEHRDFLAPKVPRTF